MEDVITPDSAYQTAWIVYINGIECPALSVSVSYGVWQIPECEITMFPDATLQRFGADDRVSVQVFYCDYWLDPNTPEFRLMFDGEIVAWSYVSVQRGRAVSFTAIDYIQIFTQLFFFFMSNVDDIAVGVGNTEIGVNAATVTTGGFGAIYPYSLFAEGLISAQTEGDGARAAPTIKRPIDFVYNIVRALTQIDAPNRSVPAANFFAPWAERTKFHRRFVALPMLEKSGAEDEGLFPILRAVKADFAMTAVARLAHSIGSAGSMWSMLQQILQTMMMEINMLPTASAVAIDAFPTDTAGGLEIKGAPGKRSFRNKPTVLTNYHVKPQFLFGIPPTCNVFYPPQIVHYAYNENYITQPTRMYFNEESWMTYLNVRASADPGLTSMLRDALAVAHPEEVHQAARASVGHPGENHKNLLVYPEEFFKGPVVSRRSMPKWFTFLEQAFQSSIDTVQPVAPAPPEGAAAEGLPAREGDEDKNVFRLYASYEFHKEKYSRRTGGLQLTFNPYPVPGYPCATMDRRSTQIDTFGYVMAVRHTMHSSGWSTQVSFSYGRTFNEMFSLLGKQFSAENARIDQQRDDTRAAVEAGRRDLLDNRGERVGATMMAPPEPIKEVRGVIQDLAAAETFYRSLFFRAAADSRSSLDAAEIRDASDRDTLSRIAADNRAALAGPIESNPDVLYSPGPTNEEANANIEEPYAHPVEAPPPTAQDGSSVALNHAIYRNLENRRAAFNYADVIEFEDAEGGREGVQIAGLSSTARGRMIAVLQLMHQGEASAEDMAFIGNALGRADMRQQGEVTDPFITEQLNNVELRVRNHRVSSNLGGTRTIVPRATAQELFKNHHAAMYQAARPICTLDEYVGFLGDDGLREGKVSPNTALAENQMRTFPAHYYTRIRKYRSGVLAATPTLNITNTSMVSGLDGVHSVGGQAEAYADSAQAGDSAAGTEASQTNANVGGTVHGIPDDFPQTHEDWDSVLLAYRANVLLHLPPRD